MATTSTVATFKAQMVTKFSSAMTDAGESSVTVDYAWPGPNTGREAIFLGRHPELAEIRIDGDSEIPSIKASRQRRQESYEVPVTVWTFSPELTPADAATVEARAFTLVGHLEDELADDPRLGLSPQVIQQSSIARTSSTLFPFNSGWACELVLFVEVDARLT